MSMNPNFHEFENLSVHPLKIYFSIILITIRRFCVAAEKRKKLVLKRLSQHHRVASHMGFGHSPHKLCLLSATARTYILRHAL
jgi:hypothetical protein